MLKKQQIIILTVLAISITGFAIFGKQFLSELLLQNVYHTCTNEDGTTLKTTKPCEDFTKSKTNEEPNKIEYSKQNNVKLTSYKGKYFSTKYPDYWYKWFSGGSADLEVFSVNLIKEKNAIEDGQANASIKVHVTDLSNSKITTVDQYIDEYYKNYSKKYTQTNIKEKPAIYTQNRDDYVISDSYSIFSNNKLYVVSFDSSGGTENDRINNYKKYRSVLDIVVDNFEFND